MGACSYPGAGALGQVISALQAVSETVPRNRSTCSDGFIPPLVEGHGPLIFFCRGKGECRYYLVAVLAPRFTPNFQEWRVVQVC